MVNIDDRILSEVNENQLFLLVAIAKHIGENSSAWPSNKTLCKTTRWSDNKLQRVKAEMVKDGLIKIHPRYKNHSQTSNSYTICTNRIGVMVNLSDIQPLPQNGVPPLPQNGVPPLPQNGGTEVLTIEVLTIEQQQQKSDAVEVEFLPTFEEEKKEEKPSLAAPPPPADPEPQPEPAPPIFYRHTPFDLVYQIEAMRGDYKMSDNFKKVTGVPTDLFLEYVNAFEAQETSIESNHNNTAELRKHFFNFSRKRYQSESKNKPKQTADERFIANLNRTLASIDVEQFR